MSVNSAPGPDPTGVPRLLRLLLLPLVLLLLGGLALWLIRPPAPRPADAPPESFSAERAMRHLGWLAAEPHPLGSPAHRRVRQRLVQELEALGLDVRLQRTEVIYDYARRPEVTRMATVTNVLARKPGTRGSGKAVALMAHYDSVPHAPGAADDGSGCAVILETLRALRHLPPLANDLLVVITDGEERGLLGAQAFVRQHPWAEDVGLVLNFEARGSRGPVFMFETSEGNAPLVRALARAAPHPFANSLSYAIYRRLPNDTDLSITKGAGLPGLNFAFNDGFYDYHTVGDDPGRLSPASVQHDGSYALGLTRHFGDAELGALAVGRGDPPAADATYFNTLGFHLVAYSMSLVPWLSVLTLALLVFVLVLAVRNGWLGAGNLARGFLAFLCHLVTTLAAVAAVAAVLGRFAGEPGLGFRALLAQDERLLAAELLLVTSVSLLVWQGFSRGLPVPGLRRPVPWTGLSLGALTGWGLLLALGTWALPGAAYLLTWPLLATLVGHTLVFRQRADEGVEGNAAGPEPATPARLLVLTLGSIPGVLWLVPYAFLFHVSLGVAQPALALLPAVLLAGLLVPAGVALARAGRGGVAGLALLAALGLSVAITWGSPFDARYPKPVEVFVWHDADTGATRWASREERPDAWTRSLLGEQPEERELDAVLPGTDATLRTAPAPTIAPPVPELKVVDNADEDDAPGEPSRSRFHLRVEGGAEAVALSLPTDAGITQARLNGKAVKVQRPDTDSDDGWWRWWYFGLPPAGVEIALDREEPEGEMEIRVAVFTYRWPGPLADRLRDRPPDRMPRPGGLADSTVVTRTFSAAYPRP